MTTEAQPPVLLVGDNVWNRHGSAIREFAPDLEVVVYEGEEPIDNDILQRVTIAFFSQDLWPERSRGFVLSVMNATNLQWFHTFSAGVDSPFFIDLMKRGVRLSNSSGATSSPIAQTAILYMLALSRNVRAWFHHQDKHEWQRHNLTELDGANLAVIGMGPIGEEIARLGVALNMNVEAIRRKATGTEPCATFGFDALDDVLGRADWVAVALPLADETRNLFNAERFARMKAGSHFINVGRGELVDEPALIEALQSGHLGGAALDVFATEPLPEDSPLWDMSNVIITPHSSGASPKAGLRSEALFVDNLRQFLKSAPLRNEIRL